MESANAIAGRGLVSLSEQQLIDCSGAQGNQGCYGGLMDNAFEYVVMNGGLGSEDSYPYQARDGRCRSVPSVVKISGYQDLPSGNEGTLASAVQTQPVSVGVEADSFVFQFYHSGVLDDPSCGTSLNHGVAIVGISATAYKVRNSWGPGWGDQGYIYLVRGRNQCGISLLPSVPVI